jgi:hypothetical protein
MSWFKDTNIDFAEIATVYRTPDQGVSAKSNSNIALNDYRKMTPQANGSNNAWAGAATQTLRLDDFADTGGIIGGANSYTTGSTKGQTSSSIVGYFTGSAAASVRGDSSSTSQGYARLGAQSGTSNLAGVANFGTPTTFGYYLDGIGSNSGSLGGTMYVIVSGSGYQASAPPENAWSSIRVRNLYPGGSTVISGTTYYNGTMTFNRSDGVGWSSSVSGTRRTWSTSWGLTGNYSGTFGWPGNAVYTIEFV